MPSLEKTVKDFNGKWQKFPDTAPKNGLPFIVGGITADQRWVDVIVRWGTFHEGWQQMCKDLHDYENKWVIHGFQTLSSLHDVTWMYWHQKPPPPRLP